MAANCATCGFPLEDAKCSVCGGDGVPFPLQDATRRREPPEMLDAVGLEATDAWRRHDHARLVAISIHSVGGQGTRTTTLAQGPAWAAGIDGVTVFAILDAATGTLSLETPLARLPQRQRVPALRTALELSGGDGLARVSLRGDRLLLRSVLRLGAVNPTTLPHALRETAAAALRIAALLETKFDARPAVDDARVPAEWDALGQPLALSGVAPPASRSIPPLSLSPDDLVEEIPAILAPGMATSAAAMPSIPKPAPLPSGGRQRRSTLNEIQLDAASARKLSVPPPPSASQGATPTDQLCDLLRHAQGLATALSYENNQATMILLVRATVYRAVYESTDATAGAVAHLYHATHGLLREVWSSRAVKRRHSSSTQIPIAEPALLAMEHVVAARGAVVETRALGITPLTSAQEVKEHLAKLQEEIDLAPAEPPLRQFLGMGALAEILVRTKLPAATEQRLREIIEHSRRAGPKASSVELLMKTIERIANA